MNVLTYSCELPPIDRREWFRYMGAPNPSPELEHLADVCAREAKNCFMGRVCYCELPVQHTEAGVDLSFGEIRSRNLSDRLLKCDRAVVFAATVGVEIDRLIAKYSHTSPAKALCLQALGTERIEALCDAFCEDVAEKIRDTGRILVPRFSAGYGDLPISLQRDLFRVLDCSRRIGVSLGESLLMSPTKSVTAIVGIRKDNK
jgi:hypothetical protein